MPSLSPEGDTSPEERAKLSAQCARGSPSRQSCCSGDARERGWGRVIQISSRNAISPHAQFGGYGAAKAAVNNFTLSLSKALSGTEVTSNGIMPGLIDTPQLDSWFVQIAEKHAGT